jgi:hypothetical protein
MRTLFALSLAGALGFAANAPAPRERSFSFECAVAVKDVLTSAHTVDIWLPAPHDDAFQRITNLRVDSPYRYEIATGSEDSHILHIRVTDRNEPAIAVTMRFDAVRKEHIQPLAAASTANGAADPAGLKRYPQPGRRVPLDDTIRRWARAISNHVVAPVKYDKSGKGWGNGDIYYACDARRGNCTGFHAIFIGYAPADASEAAKSPARREYFFGAHDENRVELSEGRDVILTPQQQGAPLNYFVYPYVELDGGKYTSAGATYSHKDLPL